MAAPRGSVQGSRLFAAGAPVGVRKQWAGACVVTSSRRRAAGQARAAEASIGQSATAMSDTTVERLSSKNVAAVILGGGAGTRLYPLTKQRAKPAVPIGGAYRLIDVPMSNCINSGIIKIYVLTQFNSTSLNRHMTRTYNFGNGIFGGGQGFVEVLAATQTPGTGGSEWFQGTADAVRQYSWLFADVKNKDVEDVLILSGDHLYRMDYMAFVKKHRDTKADVTVAALPMDFSRASDFGLMKIDSTGKIVGFAEKPKGDALKAWTVDTTILGLTKEEAVEKPFIASMGIYVFKKKVLLELLNKIYPRANDFGSEIIPAAAETMKVQAYLFNDYWEDIGTIKSFFDANLALAKQPPQFEFYDAEEPIYTSPRFLPPAKVSGAHVKDAIVAHGCYVQAGCTVTNAILGVRCRVESNVKITNTMIMGADFYESDAQRAALLASGGVPVGIGANTILNNAIIDKNARVGTNCVLINKGNVQEAAREEDGYYIRSGIVCVLRNGTIKAGTTV